MNRESSGGLKWLLPLLTGFLFLGVWTAVKHGFGQPDYMLPSPARIAEALWEERALLGPAMLATMAGAVLGFLSAALAGAGIAVLLASSKWIRTAFYPHVLIVQMIPVIVLAPLFFMWFGSGILPVGFVTFLISFFPVVANTTQGLISTDRNLVDLFKMSGASLKQEFFLLRIPYALPYYMTGLRIAASLAMIGAITGELFLGSSAGGSGGLGFLVRVYFGQVLTAAVLAAGFLACICGFLFVGSVQILNWLLLRRWHESFDQPDR